MKAKLVLAAVVLLAAGCRGDLTKPICYEPGPQPELLVYECRGGFGSSMAQGCVENVGSTSATGIFVEMDFCGQTDIVPLEPMDLAPGEVGRFMAHAPQACGPDGRAEFVRFYYDEPESVVVPCLGCPVDSFLVPPWDDEDVDSAIQGRWEMWQ